MTTSENQSDEERKQALAVGARERAVGEREDRVLDQEQALRLREELLRAQQEAADELINGPRGGVYGPFRPRLHRPPLATSESKPHLATRGRSP